MDDFDFKSPSYAQIFAKRAQKLHLLRQKKENLPGARAYYKENPIAFINDWGCTFDPRNIERNLPAVIPFILFDRQKECVDFFSSCYKNQQNAVCEKSRDMGLSWLSVAFAATMCLFHDDMNIGFASRKEMYVDKIGDLKSIFEKIRMFLRCLPREFLQGWNEKKHSSYMKISFPGTNALISGEAGDQIGRGARAAIYFIDEAAHIPHPELVDAALSQTSNCVIDISTPNGSNNRFYEKVHNHNIKIGRFSMHWTDDPRKDTDWYNRQCEKIGDPVIIAQELDLDYSSSVKGILIPKSWVEASVDAHIKLKINNGSRKFSALDVADEGKDLNGIIGIKGVMVETIDKWSGKGSDIYSTVKKTLDICTLNSYNILHYDADGVGAGVKGDAKLILGDNPKINVLPFKGGSSVVNPDKQTIEGRTNQEIFLNLKSQSWWLLRKRFQETYRAVVEGLPFDEKDIISIDSSCTLHKDLVLELSQPTYSMNSAGKIVIDKKPDGARSPNLADALMIAFAPKEQRISLFNFDTS